MNYKMRVHIIQVVKSINYFPLKQYNSFMERNRVNKTVRRTPFHTYTKFIAEFYFPVLLLAVCHYWICYLQPCV